MTRCLCLLSEMSAITLPAARRPRLAGNHVEESTQTAGKRSSLTESGPALSQPRELLLRTLLRPSYCEWQVLNLPLLLFLLYFH